MPDYQWLRKTRKNDCKVCVWPHSFGWACFLPSSSRRSIISVWIVGGPGLRCGIATCERLGKGIECLAVIGNLRGKYWTHLTQFTLLLNANISHKRHSWGKILCHSHVALQGVGIEAHFTSTGISFSTLNSCQRIICKSTGSSSSPTRRSCNRLLFLIFHAAKVLKNRKTAFDRTADYQRKRFYIFGTRWMSVTSLTVPKRIGGPKVPVPHEVYTCSVFKRYKPRLNWKSRLLIHVTGQSCPPWVCPAKKRSAPASSIYFAPIGLWCNTTVGSESERIIFCIALWMVSVPEAACMSS